MNPTESGMARLGQVKWTFMEEARACMAAWKAAEARHQQIVDDRAAKAEADGAAAEELLAEMQSQLEQKDRVIGKLGSDIKYVASAWRRHAESIQAQRDECVKKWRREQDARDTRRLLTLTLLVASVVGWGLWVAERFFR